MKHYKGQKTKGCGASEGEKKMGMAKMARRLTAKKVKQKNGGNGGK